MEGRTLKAPTWTPSGSKGFSSGSGRQNGGTLATVSGPASGLPGGAPGRNGLRIRPMKGTAAGCSSFGGSSDLVPLPGAAAGLLVAVSPVPCAALPSAMPGLPDCLDAPLGLIADPDLRR